VGQRRRTFSPGRHPKHRTNANPPVARNVTDDIARDDGGSDIFFHVTSRAEGTEVLAQGDRIRYDERFSQRSGRVEAFAVALL
jgi:cold shock CspA family protein